MPPLQQAFFWTISQGTQGAKTSGTLSFLLILLSFREKYVEFSKYVEFFERILSFSYKKSLVFLRNPLSLFNTALHFTK